MKFFYSLGLLLAVMTSYSQELWGGIGIQTAGVHSGDFKAEEETYGALPTFFVNFTKNFTPKWAMAGELSLNPYKTRMIGDKNANLESRGWDVSLTMMEAQVLAKYNFAGSKTFSMESGIALNFLLSEKYEEDPNNDGDLSDRTESDLGFPSTMLGIPINMKSSSMRLFGQQRDRVMFSAGVILWLTPLEPDTNTSSINLPDYYMEDPKIYTISIKVGYRIL